MKPKIVSLFCGVGGIDSGFKKAGFDTVFATDISKLFCESFKKNFRESKVVSSDIRKINFKEIKKNF